MKSRIIALFILAIAIFLSPKAMGQNTQDAYDEWAMKANDAGMNFNDSLAIEYYRKAFSLGTPDKYALSGMSMSQGNMGQIDSCFWYLEKAVEAGFTHYDRLEFNTCYDLAKQKQPERFSKIINGLKQKEREALIAKGYNMAVLDLLDSLALLDQRIRSVAFSPQAQAFTDAQRDSIDWAFRQIEAAGVEALRKIIKETGTIPTISMVGKKGEGNAFLLVQHADHHIGFQKEYLHLLKNTDPQEITLGHIGYLEDRVLTGEGKPQLYGTQFGLPIFEQEKVNERRAKYRMGPLESY